MTLPFYDYDSDFFSTDDLLFLAGASGKAVEDTATGNPVTFLTDLAKPLKSLVANFLPVQASGTPSPDNILPITGWDALNTFHAGKNLLNIDPLTYSLINLEVNSDGYFVNTVEDTRQTTQIYLQAYKSGQRLGNLFTNDFGTQTGRITKTFNKTQYEDMNQIRIVYNGIVKNYSILLPCYVPNGKYTFSCDIVSANQGEIGGFVFGNFQLEASETASEYEPYNGTAYPTSFPSTIYGGYVDMVTGEVWGTYPSEELTGLNVASYGTASTGIPYVRMTTQSVIKNNGNVLCDSYKTLQSVPQQGDSGCRISNQTLFVYDDRFTSESVAKEILTANPIQCVYQLASPVLITTLTPQQINAIKGNNTVWSDANGDCSVTFLKKG